MTRTLSLDEDWDEFYDPFPDWDGPTHSQRGAPRTTVWKTPRCLHWREPVQLLDGLAVFASAWCDRPNESVDMGWADVGFYLDGGWAQTNIVCSPGFRPPFARHASAEIVLYPWPDLGVPREPARFRRALRWLLKQISEGRRVEIGCTGGHGRTGCTLAGLLILQGMAPTKAIARVRARYCDEAIETSSQTKMLHSLAK